MQHTKNRRKMKSRLLSFFLVLVMVFLQLALSVSIVYATDPTFTITPDCSNSALLPTIVTVSSNQTSFTPGSCYPILENAGNTPQSITLSNSTTSSVSFTVPAGLPNGTYHIKISDPKGPGTTTHYYTIGNFVIADPLIQESVPYKSIAKDYDSAVEVSITAQYSHFALGQTAVQLISGNTVVQTATVKSIAEGSNFTQTLVFDVNTGLSPGEYKLRITTGNEVINAGSNSTGAIQIRGTPNIILDTSTLTAGYSQTTIGITGVNTGFSNTTQVDVLNQSGVSQGVVGNTSMVSSTAVNFTLNSGLSAGTYTVKVKTGVEEATAGLLVNQPTVKLTDSSGITEITSIGKYYADTSVKLIGTNTHFQNGVTQLSVFKGSQDVTATALTSSAPSISGQIISFSLKAYDVNLGNSLAIKAVTGQEEVSTTLTLSTPSISLTLNSSVANGTTVAKGYKSFKIDVAGTKTHFTSNSTISVYDQASTPVLQAGKTTSVVYSTETAMSFNLVNGLTTGDYTVVIDYDGNGATTGDQVSTAIHIGSAPTLSSLSPNPLLNNDATPVTMSISGVNTHFTAATSTPQIVVNGTLATISNVVPISDTAMSFSIVPNSITLPGTYTISVTTEGTAISETVTLTDGLTVVNQGISASLAQVYSLELGNKVITLNSTNFSFASNATLTLDGHSITPTSTTSSAMTFTIPKTFGSTPLGTGTKTISVTSDSTTYTSTLTILSSNITGITPAYKIYGYTSGSMILAGNSTVAFNHSYVPSITFNGTSVGSVTINDSDNTASFSIPTGVAAGLYPIVVTWSSGPYAGSSIIVSNFEIKHEIDQLTLYKGSSAVDASMAVYLNSPSPMQFTAITNIINGSAASDKSASSLCTWSISNPTGKTVLTNAGNGSVGIHDFGTATLSATYDGQSDQISITVLGPNSIAITGSSSSIGLGGTLSLTASAIYGDSTTQDVTSSKAVWSSSDTSKATVNATTGVVTALTEGIVTISAAYGGVTATYPLTVSSISLSPSSINTVELIATKKISVTGLDTSGNTSDLAVTVAGNAVTSLIENSLVKFILPTDATAGAKAVNVHLKGHDYSSSITIKQSAITMNKSLLITGYTGFSLEITGTNISFDDSTRKPVVKVGQNTITANTVTINQQDNKVIFPFPTGLAANTCAVELSWSGGPYDTKSISSSMVVSSDVTINITGNSSVVVGQTLTLSAFSIVNSQITDITNDATWNSSDTTKADVANGVVTGKAAGTVTITASYSGFSQTKIIVITSAVSASGGSGGSQSPSSTPAPSASSHDVMPQVTPVVTPGAETGLATSPGSTSDTTNGNNGQNNSASPEPAFVPIPTPEPAFVPIPTPEPIVPVVKLDISDELKPVMNVEENKSTIEVDSKVLIDKLNADTTPSEEAKKEIVISLAPTEAKIQEIVLPTEAVQSLIEKNANVSVTTQSATIALPTELFTQQSNAKVTIEIKSIEGVEQQQMFSQLPSSTMKNLTLTGPIVEFTITAEKGNTQEKVTKFNSTVKIELNVTAATNITPSQGKKLGIYFLNEKNNAWEYVGGRYNATRGTVEAGTRHFTKFTIMEYSKTFSDLPASHWAKDYIDTLISRHVLTGMNENEFAPSDAVTRAQFAAMLAKSMFLTLPTFKGTFKDVGETDWYTPYVEAAAASGLIRGMGDGKFNPQATITREQMAVMVMRVFKMLTGKDIAIEAGRSTAEFADLSQISSWAKNEVLAAHANGIINGINKTTFDPKRISQRSQAATIIVRLLEATGQI